MRVICRSLNESEVDHELLWFSISIGGLLCAAAWFALGLPWPVCWFHELTGRPCATCGATRAAIAFFHGHLFGAFRTTASTTADGRAGSIFFVHFGRFMLELLN